MGANKPTTMGTKSKPPKHNSKSSIGADVEEGQPHCRQKQKGMASTNANRRTQTAKKKKKARRKKKEVLRPDEDLPAEKLAGRRHCSKKVTKKAMMKKDEEERAASKCSREPKKATRLETAPTIILIRFWSRRTLPD